jgi:hypothetical protein
MKKLAFTFSVIFLAMTQHSLSQIVADAGEDKVLCVGFYGVDSNSIGGIPSAAGGTPPYTYAWETEYISNIGSFTINLSASDFLNDTTLANPEVVNVFGDTLEFRLTVTDSEGISVMDTTTIYFAYFGTHLGTVSYTINSGDSVFLSGMHNVDGGFPPYEYLWQPNHGLTDSTSLAFWAKPEYSVAYYMTLTDSSGCVVTGAPVYYVSVLPVSIEDFESPNAMIKIYPNPVNDLLNVQINPKIQGDFNLRLFLSDGRLVREESFSHNEFTVDVSGYPAGVYLYEISDGKEISDRGRIVIK